MCFTFFPNIFELGQLKVIGQYYRDAESQFRIFRIRQLCDQIFQIGFSKGKINEEFEPARKFF